MVGTNGNNQKHSFSLSPDTILDEYEQVLEAANKSQKTIDGYIQNSRQYFDFLEYKNMMKPIEVLGKKELREYVMHLRNRTSWPKNPYIKPENRKKLSPFAVQAYVRDIKTLWSWMYKYGYIEVNPLAGFPLPAVPEKLVTVITLEQFAILLSKIDISTPDGLRYYCILLILFDNGMRISELVKIEIADIDFAGKTIKVMGKRRIERYVPITIDTRRNIIKYMKGARLMLCPEKCPYLFANTDGEPISINSVQQFMRRLLENSELKGVKFSPHILRHSSASHALANGANIRYIQYILGHKSITTTMKYLHVQVQDIQKQHGQFSPVAHLFRKRLIRLK